MTGPAPSKKKLKGCSVYLHKKDAATNSRSPHIDVECPGINKYIKPGETTFAGGKKGGVFIGLKKNQLRRFK